MHRMSRECAPTLVGKATSTGWNETRIRNTRMILPARPCVMHSTWIGYCVSAQSCPTLRDPTDCSPPSSSIRGIFQARIVEWVATSSSRESSQPRDQILMHGILANLCNSPKKQTTTHSSFTVRKLRHREAKEPAQGHTASKWQNSVPLSVLAFLP